MMHYVMQHYPIRGDKETSTLPYPREGCKNIDWNFISFLVIQEMGSLAELQFRVCVVLDVVGFVHHCCEQKVHCDVNP
jgi:hypothetical protein